MGPFPMWPGTQGEVLFSPGDSHHLLPCLLPRSMEKSQLETAHRPLVARVFLTHSHLPGGALPFSELLSSLPVGPPLDQRFTPSSYVHLSSKSTGMGCHFCLQQIFPTQGSNPHLLHWQVDSLPLSHKGSPVFM